MPENNKTGKGRYTHLYKNKRWYKLRSHQLKIKPVCEYCLERDGRITRATIVDHYVPHRGNDELFKDPENLRSACKQCHDSWKQRIERRGISDIGVDDNNMPRDPNHHWHHT